jgi:uncharacterized membrane protein
MAETAPASPTTHRARLYGTERLTAFSDGVFAIAITLLVLELRLPELATDAPLAVFAGALQGVLPRLISFLISFFVIGLFWQGHHRMFHVIVRTDSALAFINLVLMLFVALIPFPTAVLGRYAPSQPLAVMVYAGMMVLAGLVSTSLWLYAMRHRELLASGTTSRQLTHFILRALAMPAIFLVSIFIACVNAGLAMWSWWLILAVRVAIERLWRD